MTRGPRQVLVVEDAAESREFLGKTITAIYPDTRLLMTGSVREFRAVVATPPPADVDLAVVDLNLPDGDGNQIISALRMLYPDCLIMVYTMFDDDSSLFKALKCGADGYLLKMDSEERLHDALVSIMVGEPPLSPKIALRMLREFREREHVVDIVEPAAVSAADGGRPAAELLCPGSAYPLTPREVETLTLVAKGLRLPDLAIHLNVTRSTAATYLKRIYRKLAISSRAEATLEAARLGLVKVERS